MKHLIFVNGTMGVGKTTTCQQLKKILRNSVFLDGDWCWDASPFIVNEETKAMVIDNITTMLTNFISCSVYENIIFCWVMDEQEIVDTIISKLTGEYTLFTFSLICSETGLITRIQKDIARGLRKEDSIQRSIERNKKYQTMDTTSIEVTNHTPLQTAQVIATAIENGYVGG